MGVTPGTSKAATSIRKPTPVDTIRIGGSSCCTGINLAVAADAIVLDNAADSNFPFPGADRHHIIYIKTVTSSVTVEASADNSGYITIATVLTADGATVVRTGNVTELPYRYIRVTTVGGTATLDVQTFPALVR